MTIEGVKDGIVTVVSRIRTLSITREDLEDIFVGLLKVGKQDFCEAYRILLAEHKIKLDSLQNVRLTRLGRKGRS